MTNAKVTPEQRAALERYVDAACSQWPELHLPEGHFVAYVLERSTEFELPPLEHAGDMLLACACALGSAPAIGALQRRCDPAIARVLSRRKASSALADDTRQGVYERLLVSGDQRPPRIADYRGVGRLEGWIATAVANELMTQRRAATRRREDSMSAGAMARAVPLDPELELLRASYKEEFERAIVSAVRELSDRDRTLLRLHLGERLSIDTLGGMYGVNRATAARWLVAARRSLFEQAKTIICARLGLNSNEYESVGAALQSQLHVSLLRHMA
jgi:RNA polymerase sigma-70 factor (ECF subfamily)